MLTALTAEPHSLGTTHHVHVIQHDLAIGSVVPPAHHRRRLDPASLSLGAHLADVVTDRPLGLTGPLEPVLSDDDGVSGLADHSTVGDQLPSPRIEREPTVGGERVGQGLGALPTVGALIVLAREVSRLAQRPGLAKGTTWPLPGASPPVGWSAGAGSWFAGPVTPAGM